MGGSIGDNLASMTRLSRLSVSRRFSDGGGRERLVRVLAYARHLADDEARQPCGGDHLRRLRRKLDLGEDEIAVPELVDLPGEIPVRQAVALFDDAVTGGERPEL